MRKVKNMILHPESRKEQPQGIFRERFSTSPILLPFTGGHEALLRQNPPTCHSMASNEEDRPFTPPEDILIDNVWASSSKDPRFETIRTRKNS